MEPDWAALVDRLERDYPTESAMLEALGRFERGENAFPDDLRARGRQIFETACAMAADRLCDNPAVVRIVGANGPRTSEALTIVPLLFNLLPDGALKEASVALVALLIVRMGVGTFCARYRRSHSSPPDAS